MFSVFTHDGNDPCCDVQNKSVTKHWRTQDNVNRRRSSTIAVESHLYSCSQCVIPTHLRNYACTIKVPSNPLTWLVLSLKTHLFQSDSFWSHFNISDTSQPYFKSFISEDSRVVTKLLSEQHSLLSPAGVLLPPCIFVFSWRIQFHFVHHAAHHARSTPLCCTVATLLCGGNDCRCARKPLVGMRRCKQDTNKHYVFQSDWRVCFTPWSVSRQIPPAPPLPRPNRIIIFQVYS